MQVGIYDVFAESPYCGNQAAVVRVGNRRLSDTQLVTLAGEFSLAETVLSSLRGGDLVFRFANADRVLNRCGHATLAGVADYVSTLSSPRTKRSEWSGRYCVGPSIANWRAWTVPMDGGRRTVPGLEVAVAWPDRPKFAQTLPSRALYQALRLDSTDAPPELPLCIYNSGNRNALVPVRTVTILKQARPDWPKLKALFKQFHLTDLHLYCLQKRKRSSKQFLLRCRNLFPYGVLEETATGSASVALAASLADHLPELQRGSSVAGFTFEQGIGSRRGRICVRWQSRTGGPPLIWLEGRVFPAMRGHLISIPSS
jgi:PhzF family phenazine biosynthesis protein